VSFPDVVDSRFTGQVDSLPDSDIFPSIHNHITKRDNGKTAEEVRRKMEEERWLM
jgi:hypothetical protein